MKADLGINPGSEKVRYTAERDGILSIFEDIDGDNNPFGDDTDGDNLWNMYDVDDDGDGDDDNDDETPGFSDVSIDVGDDNDDDDDGGIPIF